MKPLRALIWLLLSTTLPAQAADLIEIYRAALTNDAQFAAARAQHLASREKLPQARAGLLPSVTLSASTSWNETEVKEPLQRDLNYNANSYIVQLTQPLFRWQNWLQFDQAKLQLLVGDAQLTQARQDLITRVTQAYFDVLYSEDTLTFSLAQQSAIAQQLEQAKRNFEVGTSTIVDSHEAQARFDLAVSQELAAQNDLAVKRQQLATIIGAEPPALKPLRETLEITRPQPDTPAPWVDAAEQGNPNVVAQRAGLDIARREVERNRAAHYPTIDAVATLAHNRQPISALADANTQTLGVQLNLPLYSGGALSARDREAAALADRAQSDLDFARRSAALAARQSYLGVTAGIAQVKALEAALRSSNLALASNKTGYEVGVRINIDVLNAQQQVFATRRDLARARYDTLLAQLRLKAAAGRLDETDLQAINALLQPVQAAQPPQP
jgi:outer membrane protein